jgi:hypothetical protein
MFLLWKIANFKQNGIFQNALIIVEIQIFGCTLPSGCLIKVALMGKTEGGLQSAVIPSSANKLLVVTTTL